MTFSDLRPYLPGDDIRRIDWSATARTGTPYTRLYQEERARTITLIADISRSCTPTKRKLLTETAGLLAFAAVSGEDQVALITFSDRVERLIRPGRGIRHAQRIASEIIAAVPQGDGTNLVPPLNAALGLNRRPGLMILLSDLHCRIPLSLLQQISCRHDLVTLLLRDRLETEPPPAGLVQYQDAETGGLRLFDLTSKATRSAVNNIWSSHDRQLRKRLERLRSRTAVLQSGRSPLPELIRLFRQGGRR